MARSVLLALLAGAALIYSAAGASASAVRSCGDLPESSTHRAISNVTSRGLTCSQARRAAVPIFHRCSTGSCYAAGRHWSCRDLGAGEAVDERCISGQVVVRFQTGV
jgi:hypothetical protein